MAARLASDVMRVPTLPMARTDAQSALLMTSDIDPRDRKFIRGGLRTREGFHALRGGLACAIARALAYAPYADLIWCETSEPSPHEARQLADAIHAQFPGKLLAYNCSPPFNWKKKLHDHMITGSNALQIPIRDTGRLSRFELEHVRLATSYRECGMTAYVTLQKSEIDPETRLGYRAVKHQRFVGAAYFDANTDIISSGAACTTARPRSTVMEQFETPTEPRIREIGIANKQILNLDFHFDTYLITY